MILRARLWDNLSPAERDELHDASAILAHKAGTQTVNQCDGCRRGLPFNKFGHHFELIPKTGTMPCTKAASIPSASTRMSELVPTTWLDGLLTGPDAVVSDASGFYTGKDIERLLAAVKKRIQDAEAANVK